MRSLASTVAAALVLLLLSLQQSHAQCVNSATPSCGVYDSCFANRCNCNASPFEYFRTYGKKYCSTFLDLPNLSTAGKAWRDSTLRCLQEAIVPMLPKDGEASSCDCKDMQLKAYDSHVACYTQPSNSICALPKADWLIIFEAAGGVGTLVDQKGRKQMLDVATICIPIAAADAKEAIQKIIDRLRP